MSGKALYLVPRPAVDEAALIDRARAGDGEAREQLVGRYLQDVYDVTFRVLGDRDLAQDAAQDAFVNALNGLARFRGDASFRTWLLRIAVNTAKSVGRWRGRRREVSLEVTADRPGRAPDPAVRAVLKDEAARASAWLARLPEKQRLAVSLRIHEDLSYAEIGRILDCTEGAARVNYHLGIKRLREMFNG